MRQKMTREVYRRVGEMAGGVSQSPDISSARDGVGGSRTGTGTVPIPQMKVEIPKYRDGDSIHQFFLVYKTSMMTLSRYPASNGAPICPAISIRRSLGGL